MAMKLNAAVRLRLAVPDQVDVAAEGRMPGPTLGAVSTAGLERRRVEARAADRALADVVYGGPNEVAWMKERKKDTA